MLDFHVFNTINIDMHIYEYSFENKNIWIYKLHLYNLEYRFVY